MFGGINHSVAPSAHSGTTLALLILYLLSLFGPHVCSFCPLCCQNKLFSKTQADLKAYMGHFQDSTNLKQVGLQSRNTINLELEVPRLFIHSFTYSFICSLIHSFM